MKQFERRLTALERRSGIQPITIVVMYEDQETGEKEEAGRYTAWPLMPFDYKQVADDLAAASGDIQP